MWQIHALMAMDIARERAAEAEAATWAARIRDGRPSAWRRLSARALRGMSEAAATLARTTATAARSVDGAG